ncbi:MAG: acyl-CoA dehydrogenase family protein [Thermodesulfobacteriota bacterium]
MEKLTEEELLLRESVRKFFANELEPIVEQMEKEGRPPRELIKKMGDLGFLGSFFPEEYGGSNLSLTSRAIISEETARICAGFDITLFADIILFARAVLNHGTHAQKEKYMRPVILGEKIGALAITEPDFGTDALGIKTSAIAEGDYYRLNGSKTFITNAPIADYFAILARTSQEKSKIRGGTWFILERGLDGLETGPPLEKLGMRSSPTGQVFLNDVKVHKDQILGEKGEGFKYLMEALDIERLMEGASTMGIAEACLEAAAKYARERVVFGRPIGDFQLIQEKIAEMAVGIEMGKTYLYQLCRVADEGKAITREASILKLYSSSVTMQAAKDAVQIMGGYGYMEEYKVARYFRDAKHHEIGAGTSEIQKVIIARETLKG